MYIFFFIFLGSYILGNIYVFFRGMQAICNSPVYAKVLFTIVYWCLALLIIMTYATRKSNLPNSFSHFLYEVGNGWLVFTLYMVIALLAMDLIRLFNREFSWGFVIAFLLTIGLLSYGYYTYKHPKTQVINIDINKPVNTAGKALKVVAISDLHLGNGANKKQLQKYILMIKKEQPDLILIGGDLIDNSVAPLYYQKMAEELSQLHAPFGVYMVPGNHEYISGIRESIGYIRRLPFHFLQDSVVTLSNGVQIVGRDDRSNHSRKSLSELMQAVDPDKPVILLDHQPYDLDKTEAAGVDLQFSGHTHHGQVWPMNWLTDHLFEVSHGYKKKGNSHIYVSSGLALWGPPFRIGTSSEMVVFRLTFK